MLVYVLFGTCKDISVGPEAILSLIVVGLCASTDEHTVPGDAVFLSLIAGIVQVAMGLCRLGKKAN